MKPSRGGLCGLLAAWFVLAGCSGAPNAAVPVPLPVEAPPAAVDVPAIGAHSTLIGLGLNPDGTVQVPPVRTPLQAGYIRVAPQRPGVAPLVVLAHVDGDGHPGLFAHLKQVKPGDQVRVSWADGTTRTYTVTRVQETPKAAFPTEAVYGATPTREIRLVTCGGPFDQAKHSYTDSEIVYGTEEMS